VGPLYRNQSHAFELSLSSKQGPKWNLDYARADDDPSDPKPNTKVEALTPERFRTTQAGVTVAQADQDLRAIALKLANNIPIQIRGMIRLAWKRQSRP
jgi:hypothetical protein